MDDRVLWAKKNLLYAFPLSFLNFPNNYTISNWPGSSFPALVVPSLQKNRLDIRRFGEYQNLACWGFYEDLISSRAVDPYNLLSGKLSLLPILSRNRSILQSRQGHHVLKYSVS